MRKFNTTGVCVPSKHYMVDLTERVAQIRRMVDDGEYFTINRARQYGKTTTINALKNALAEDYVVLSLDFQGIGNAGFATEERFVQEFCRLVWNRRRAVPGIPDEVLDRIRKWKESDEPKARLGKLFDVLTEWCEQSDKGVVLIVDEVDSAINNQVFLDFLAQLRSLYLRREKNHKVKTFQSVILAGVTDVKHLKSKIRDDEQRKVNSPWNIAADFDVDMSLQEAGIRGMLEDYEADHHTGMDAGAVARQIREWTGGYPYLVSRICQLADEKLAPTLADPRAAWTRRGMDEAIKMLVEEDNALFHTITGKLSNYPSLKASIRSILMEGERVVWSQYQEDIAQMQMYGLIRNDHNAVRVANRVFETVLYNLFIVEEQLQANVFSREGGLARNAFVRDGRLNMRLVLERFVETYTQVCGPLLERFREKDGREQFLLYLKPIINGTGNYYVEAQTRDQTRTDVVVDYLGEQFVVELKIWRGERYNEAGERQISAYLDHFGLTTGYMLSFNFNKHKVCGLRLVHVGDKLLYEATV